MNLWADCLETVGSSTSHNPVGLHGFLRARIHLFLKTNVIGIILKANFTFQEMKTDERC
jgi:hypothetical protein